MPSLLTGTGELPGQDPHLPQDPRLVTDPVSQGSGQNAQRVSLPDWLRVGAALGQLLSWPGPVTAQWRLTRVPGGHRLLSKGDTLAAEP